MKRFIPLLFLTACTFNSNVVHKIPIDLYDNVDDNDRLAVEVLAYEWDQMVYEALGQESAEDMRHLNVKLNTMNGESIAILLTFPDHKRSTLAPVCYFMDSMMTVKAELHKQFEKELKDLEPLGRTIVRILDKRDGQLLYRTLTPENQSTTSPEELQKILNDRAKKMTKDKESLFVKAKKIYPIEEKNQLYFVIFFEYEDGFIDHITFIRTGEQEFELSGYQYWNPT